MFNYTSNAAFTYLRHGLRPGQKLTAKPIHLMRFRQINQIHRLLTTRYVLNLICIFLCPLEIILELFKTYNTF